MFTNQQIDAAHQAVLENTGKGVKLAVLDTGIDWSHPVFENLEAGNDIAFEENASTVSSKNAVDPDPFGHGTAIASIIHRLAPDASLGSIRVLSGDARSGCNIVHAGAKLGIRENYKILHCSFGSQLRARLPDFKTWIDAAYLKQVHVVGATSNLSPTRTDYPSHFPSVIGLSGVSKSADYRIGFHPDRLVQFTLPVDGFVVAWRENAYRKVGGTSFAAPIMTALAAKLLETWPEATPHELKALLIHLAKREIDLTEMLSSQGIIEN